MSKIVTVGMTALFVTASPLAYAQSPSVGGALERLSAADLSALTDARITILKAALQLTPDQEKNWPAVEDAIRVRAKDRQARVANVAARVGELRDRSVIEVLRDRNPIDFLHRRADALAQRAADLKKLADAWQPLYQTLNPDQKRRMAFLTIFVLQEMRDALEQRRILSEDDDER
jgi:LTXXQ motif family protein